MSCFERGHMEHVHTVDGVEVRGCEECDTPRCPEPVNGRPCGLRLDCGPLGYQGGRCPIHGTPRSLLDAYPTLAA